MISIVASAKPPLFIHRFSQRKKKVEQARTLNVRRIHDDLKLLARREIEFTKSFLEDAFPFDVEVDEDLLDALMPVKFRYKHKDDDDTCVYVPKVDVELEDD